MTREDALSYIEAAARATGLPLAEPHRAGAAEVLVRLSGYAHALETGDGGSASAPSPAESPRGAGDRVPARADAPEGSARARPGGGSEWTERPARRPDAIGPRPAAVPRGALHGPPVSVRGIAAAVREGRVSAARLAEEALARARADRCNAFTRLFEARARRDAAAVDARVAAGEDPGPLAGVPFAVKDLFDVAGEVTLAGSRALAGDPPARADAALVAAVAAAGGVLIGATGMDELAYGFTSENGHDGAVLNPHDPARTAGGSSGGSAAAVAAGIVPIALGTDTNGSIRVPASLCGVCGWKPGFGRLDRSGAHPFVASLDHVGLFAADVEDMTHAFAALGGAAPSAPARVAVLAGHFAGHAAPEAAAAVAEAAGILGAERTVALPLAARARAAAFVVTAAEGGRLHRRRLAALAHRFDPAVRDRLIAGALLPAGWLLAAQEVRAAFTAQALAAFEEADVLIAPATPAPAPRLDGGTVGGEPARTGLGLFTQPLTLTGVPIAVVPWGGAALPIGVQIAAAPGREDHALGAALALERAGFSDARGREARHA